MNSFPSLEMTMFFSQKRASSMCPSDELERLRTETSELRRRIASAERTRNDQRVGRERVEKRLKDAEQERMRTEEMIDALQKENGELKEEVTELKNALARVSLTNTKLTGMLFKTSKKREYSHMDPPPETAVKRKLGGQPGHAGHGRHAPQRIDEEKTAYLTQCPSCETTLSRTGLCCERIVEDIVVPQRTKITKWFIERQWCKTCKKEVRATPQGAVPGFRIGAAALGLILFQKYRLRLPLDAIEENLKASYGMDLTSGAIANILQKMATKLGFEYRTIIEEIRGSPVKHGDETSWRIDGQNGWAWAFCSPTATAYTIEETRGKTIPDLMLGKSPTGVLVRDDYASYAHLPMEQQSCWAHLLRNSRDAARQEEVSAEMKKLNKELLKMYQKLSRVIEQQFDKEEREKEHARYSKKIAAIAKRRFKAEDVRAIQTRIRNQGNNLITALLHENVPLTNNFAERQIRPLAVMRKISGGSRSNEGARTHAVNMSIVQTIRLKGRPFFERMRELLSVPNQGYSAMEPAGKN
jgi:hypothetical protein